MSNIRIDADLLIVGDGEIIKNGSVVIENSTIKYAGESEHAPSAGQNLQVPAITPGFWDCHAHYFGLTKFDYEERFLDPLVKIMRCAWDTEQTLRAGVTSVREVGGFGINLKNSITEGTIIGPRIYAAGSMISMTAGHGDAHSLPSEVFDYFAQRHRVTNPIADGVAEVTKLVRTHIRAGAEIIKFAASGGVMSEIDPPLTQQYSAEEQRAIMDEAARADLAVAAHCYGPRGMKVALEAGVKTIEHGTYIDEDLCDLMIEKDAILVPTVYTYKGLFGTPEAKENTPEYGYRKGQLILKTHTKMLSMAINRGVKIAMGTDIIITGPYHPIYQYGDNLRELQYFVDAGMSPLQAISAGTMMGPQTLGKRGPQSGLLREGFDADLVIFNENPLDDISKLNDRSNIQNVIKQGKPLEPF
ncbi:MAG: amidohydrolase family protein [Candidatus Heimdallarchaeota archaeon]|nr:amidohydrolase family protein [Candidatus Heimdallarchaeota archaeon]